MNISIQKRPVVVVDFGAQYAKLIARRVREAALYSEIMPHTASANELFAKKPAAIILSGGPSSVYDEGAPVLDDALLNAGVPVFGICYGFQAMVRVLGGTVEHTGLREYGATQVQIEDTTSTLFSGHLSEQSVWMSHSDSASMAPDGIRVTATTSGAAIAAIEDDERQLYGVQWHPEVMHSSFGRRVLENFLLRGAGLCADWVPGTMIEDLVGQVREQVGDARAICAFSGGVDSSVAGALVQQAIGDQLICVFVDHGLLREGEAEQVAEDFVKMTGVGLIVVDASQQFLSALAGVSSSEEKRKIIGREFIRVFEQTARDIVQDRVDDKHPVKFLVQGTLYPDVVESGGSTSAANIKSHHNVGGLPDDLQFKLIEPLRLLFKDEVRQVGLEIGVPEEIVHRQPFPGPGLGIRIVGEVTAKRLQILRAADKIAREELSAAGLDREIWQCPVVLLADVRSVGVQGDGRTYGHPIVLRPVSSEDAMTADWTRLSYDVLARISGRIINEVSDVNRVVLDVTSKPPGTIEWE